MKSAGIPEGGQRQRHAARQVTSSTISEALGAGPSAAVTRPVRYAAAVTGHLHRWCRAAVFTAVVCPIHMFTAKERPTCRPPIGKSQRHAPCGSQVGRQTVRQRMAALEGSGLGGMGWQVVGAGAVGVEWRGGRLGIDATHMVARHSHHEENTTTRQR